MGLAPRKRYHRWERQEKVFGKFGESGFLPFCLCFFDPYMRKGFTTGPCPGLIWMKANDH